jgi:hypothetical protein
MSIDYTLANELKDAGFPQGGNGRWLVDPKQIVARGGDRAYVPTLEELIEACGESFASLHRSVKSEKWVAQNRICDEDDGPHGSQGSSPTEAVARLWLALNKNF